MNEPEEFPEATAGREEALKAWRESRRAHRDTRGVVDRVSKQLQESAALRQRNHFTDGVRSMLRGVS